MTKNKSWTFDHPILDSLPPFDNNKILELVDRIKEGDKTANDELLYVLLAYIKLRLPALLSRLFLLRSDLDGLVGHLIEWLIVVIRDKHSPSILNYVSKSLTSTCIRYQNKLNVFGPLQLPKTNWWHKNRKLLTDDIVVDDLNSIKQVILLEELFSHAKTKLEKEYIKLRLEGYTSKEIAEKAGVTKQAVSRVKRNLYKSVMS